MTWGEAQEYVEVAAERRRRDAQTQSVIAFCHAALIGKLLSGESDDVSVMTAFPFWSEEEIAEQRRRAIYEQMMKKIGRGGDTNGSRKVGG